MSDTCPTVKVKSPVSDDNPDGFIVINESDLTSEQELFEATDSGAESDEFDSMDKVALRAYLTEKGIGFHPKNGETKLREFAREAAAVAAAVTVTV